MWTRKNRSPSPAGSSRNRVRLSSSASRAPAKSPRHWASTPSECRTAASTCAIVELLAQRAALGVEALGAVVATRHVLIDTDLVERVGDGAAVAQRPEDRDPLGAELAEPVRSPQAEPQPARRPQRLRAQPGGRRGRRQRRLQPAAALLEVTAGHPHRPHVDGQRQRLLRLVPQRPPERRAQVVVIGREPVEPDDRPGRRALRIGRARELEVEGEMARRQIVASPASTRRSRANWRTGSSSR